MVRKLRLLMVAALVAVGVMLIPAAEALARCPTGYYRNARGFCVRAGCPPGTFQHGTRCVRCRAGCYYVGNGLCRCRRR
jgi:hypothetical protein